MNDKMKNELREELKHIQETLSRYSTLLGEANYSGNYHLRMLHKSIWCVLEAMYQVLLIIAKDYDVTINQKYYYDDYEEHNKYDYE